MSSILDKIITTKKEEVARLKKERAGFGGRSSAHRSFIKAIRNEGRLSVIAEVKKASPSKGIICADFDPRRIAADYFKGGASAMSVLTDEKYFMGSPAYLQTARSEVPLPVIRKDFIIDPVQVEQTVSMDADAMLLIAACLSNAQMDELLHAATEFGLDVLVEIHSRKELDRVLGLSLVPQCIGVNNRDLATFTTDINTTIEIAPHVPKNITLVSESGIDNGDQSKRLFDAGVSAILVGESLMRTDDVAGKIKELTNKR